MSRWRSLLCGLLWSVAAATASAPIASCGGASAAGASEPGDGGGGAMETEPDAECCCQRYNEDGDPTGASTSDQMSCKSTGGTCTDDTTQCEEE
jgi:hypothetical protein